MLYIVYATVDPASVSDWTTWMKDVHIPDVLDTECFEYATFTEDPAAENSFRIAYLARSEADFERYQSEFGPALREDHTSRFGSVVAARRELLPVIATY